MADDPQRNFRSAYYEKVGFRGVEEKKSLEILLKDNPLGGYHFIICRGKKPDCSPGVFTDISAIKGKQGHL